MVSGGMSCVKYLLFCFNLIFALTGIAILTIGAIVHIVYSHYSSFVDDNYQSTPTVLIIVGVLIFVIAFFGCCGAVKENICMIVTFSVFLVIIIILELVTGALGYMEKDQVGKMLANNLNRTMYSYGENKDITSSWDIAQHEGECCGVYGPGDWYTPRKTTTLPHTCCPNMPPDGKCTIEIKEHYNEGCFDKLKDTLTKYGTIIGGIGIIIAIIQIIGVLFACCLVRSIRKEYETV